MVSSILFSLVAYVSDLFCVFLYPAIEQRLEASVTQNHREKKKVPGREE
jgi:hypothetical protein